MFARLVSLRSGPHLIAWGTLIVSLLLFLDWHDGWTTLKRVYQWPALELRIAWVISVLLISLYVVLLLTDALVQATTKRWWDPAETFDGELTWQQLLELVQRDHDPLLVPRRLRTGSATASYLLMLPVIVLIAGLTAATIRFVWMPTLPGFLRPLPPTAANPAGLRAPVDALLNLGGNLGALLALIAASISIWFTYHQLRAKVRADNRQQWLARTRTLLGQVVALAAAHAEADDTTCETTLFTQLNPLRLEFELMLNPSEKDHRLLMYLLRRLTFLRDLKQADAADEGVLVRLIKDDCRRVASLPGAQPFERWQEVLEADKVPILVTQCMRLGHVVLKREWERVKATR